MIITGPQLWERLKETLGLPKYTKRFELYCAQDDVVIVKCWYMPEVEGGADELVEKLAEYELVERRRGHA